MGEVYKGRDTRLGRSVALKVLHAHVAEDPELRRRFEQEARAVSQLSHPHIATLFDVGHHDGSEFIVMELVDGETLADRLKRGPLPVELALRVAIEIADGLDHAHRAGITHRDLKPANIMLSRSGAKLLDFGLAKLRNRAAEVTSSLDRAVAHLPQAVGPRPTTVYTQHGTILGTFEYMAPEQVQGADVDPRTDIFAFGSLLYEMLTGRKAFEAATQASLIGAILVSEPPLMEAYRPGLPPLLDMTVRRCLAKDAEDRWQTVRDLLVALRWVSEHLTNPRSSQPAVRSRKMAAVMAVPALVAVAAITYAAWAIGDDREPTNHSLTRWDVALPAGQSLAAELHPALAISPDGTHVVFGAHSGTSTQLFVRRADEFEAKPISGSVDGHTPFFSPDGQWIGFMARGKILKVPVIGGFPQLVCDAPSLAPGSPGATWGADNTIVFASGLSGLMRVSVAGGIPELLTKPDSARGEVTHISPQFLPSGSDLLFTVRTDDEGWRVAILSMTTRQWQWLPPIGEVASARYSRTGHLIYAQSGNLFGRPLSLSDRTFTGASFPLTDDVYTRVVTDALVAQFAISDGGVLAFISGQPPDWTLVSVDGAGREIRLLTDTPHMYRYPRFSPNGRQIAVTVEEQRTDIFIVDERGSMKKLTKNGTNTTPAWAPNGEQVTFGSRRPGSDAIDIYSAPTDDSSDPAQLVTGADVQVPGGWSPDGDSLAFYEVGNNTARDIWIWSRRQRRRHPLLVTAANERGVSFSPDGSWLTYVSNDSGRDEIYVQRYPGAGSEIVSKGGGTEPVWAPNSREVFYRNNGQLFAVSFRTEPRIVADAPRVLFSDRYVVAPAEAGRPNYDVSPDGKSFVMVRSVDRSPTHLHVVQNWPEQLMSSAAAARGSSSVPQFLSSSVPQFLSSSAHFRED
jgi:serine/threonine protein kinase/Tol biopolymer transport system component